MWACMGTRVPAVCACLSVRRIRSDRWCGWGIHYQDTESLPQQCTVWMHPARPWRAPEPRPVKPGAAVMESPHHGALDPGSHPRSTAEAAHSGALGHRNAIQMYSADSRGGWAKVCVCVCVPAPGARVPTKGQSGWRYFLLLPCLRPRGGGYFHYCRENSLKSLNLVRRWRSVPEDVRRRLWGALMKRRPGPWRNTMSAALSNGHRAGRERVRVRIHSSDGAAAVSDQSTCWSHGSLWCRKTRHANQYWTWPTRFVFTQRVNIISSPSNRQETDLVTWLRSSNTGGKNNIDY